MDNTTSIESKYADSIFAAVPDNPGEHKEDFLKFCAIIFDEVTKQDLILKWQFGESEHGILTRFDASQTNWFGHAKNEIVDLYNYWRLYLDNPPRE